MRFPKSFGLVLVLLSLVACSKLPVQTSLGELHRMKKVQSVNVNTTDPTDIRLVGPDLLGLHTISAGKGETLVLLYFRGKKDIELPAPWELPNGTYVMDSSHRPFSSGTMPCLEDSSGRHFGPSFKGTDSADGALSPKGWVYEGDLRGFEGGWVSVGTLTTPDPHFAFVYRVPKDAKGLKLNDRGQALALE
ncbi:MAG: hypothetical protein ABSH01_15350 [Terriglobia bacterium]